MKRKKNEILIQNLFYREHYKEQQLFLKKINFTKKMDSDILNNALTEKD